MNSFENLERIAFEAAEDMHNDGITIIKADSSPLFG
ncbi:MAG: hypothetical protein Ct9H90mP17_1820 [Actinomycetota bacterium]|nr:MAG: hypothetical protein Ct9H90mP17_1820 [Actinomycetota bacterium]